MFLAVIVLDFYEMATKSIMPILDQCDSMIRNGLARVARPTLVRLIPSSSKLSATEEN